MSKFWPLQHKCILATPCSYINTMHCNTHPAFIITPYNTHHVYITTSNVIVKYMDWNKFINIIINYTAFTEMDK